MKRNVLFIALCCMQFALVGQNLLSSKYNQAAISKILTPQDKWSPFPKLSDREAWAKADQKAMKSYYESALNYLQYDWPAIPATTSLLFSRTGNRTEYQNLNFKKREVLATLLLGEIYENKGRFTDQIINGVWSICEESYWGISAHLNQWHTCSILPDVNDPYVDLFAAETATFLAWIDYFMGEKLDAVSPIIRKRIYSETDKRIFTPVMTNVHPWMGLNKSGRRPNNWNPWISSNWMNAALLLEKNELRRAEMITKILSVLDQFLNPYPADGGCDEGPGYWNASGASLFDNISMLNLATNNAFDYALKDQKVRNIGSYIYRAQISEKYFLNFADASPKPSMSGSLIWRFGLAIEDAKMQRFGAWYRDSNLGKVSASQLFRVFFDLFLTQEMDKTSKELPLPKVYWLPDLEVMVARDKEGVSDGFFLGAKGGNNDESHNHNDVGNYVVYYNGLPLLIDVGSGTYTARTFGPRRYEIWSNCSDYHNLPTVNGFTEKEGPQFKASEVKFKQGADFSSLSLNIASAYPTEAGIISLNRTLTLNRGKGVQVVEELKLSKMESFVEHFMTCYPVDVTLPGRVIIHYQDDKGGKKDFMLKYDATQFEAAVEAIKLDAPEDAGVKNKWGETIQRINLTAKNRKDGARPVSTRAIFTISF